MNKNNNIVNIEVHFNEHDNKYTGTVTLDDAVVFTNRFNSKEDAQNACEVAIGEQGLDEATTKTYMHVTQKVDNSWVATFKINKEKYHAGSYTNQLDAALAHDRFIKRHKLDVELLELTHPELLGNENKALDRIVKKSDRKYAYIVQVSDSNSWIARPHIKNDIKSTSITVATEEQAAYTVDLILEELGLFKMYNQDVDPNLANLPSVTKEALALKVRDKFKDDTPEPEPEPEVIAPYESELILYEKMQGVIEAINSKHGKKITDTTALRIIALTENYL